MGVQLGAPGFGVVEIAPGHEMDPAQADLFGDGGQNVAVAVRAAVAGWADAGEPG